MQALLLVTQSTRLSSGIRFDREWPCHLTVSLSMILSTSRLNNRPPGYVVLTGNKLLYGVTTPRWSVLTDSDQMQGDQMQGEILGQTELRKINLRIINWLKKWNKWSKGTHVSITLFARGRFALLIRTYLPTHQQAWDKRFYSLHMILVLSEVWCDDFHLHIMMCFFEG